MISERGEQLGVMSIQSALNLARESFLDLVEVGPQATPPVVKIVDFGKLQYEKEKQDRKNRARSKKGGEIKGIRLTVAISEHDMNVRIASAQKFLDKGDKIKVEMRMRGREKAHPEVAQKTIQRFIDTLGRDTVLEQPIKRMGGQFTAMLTLKKK